MGDPFGLGQTQLRIRTGGRWRRGGRHQKRARVQREKPARARFRGQALAGGRRAAQQHGRGRVQARRPRPDLPQVHLRRLRGASTPSSTPRRRRAPTPRTRTSTAPRTSSGCRQEARWSHLKAQREAADDRQARRRRHGGIERDNPTLKGVLPKDYARPALDKQRLGQLIDLDQQHRPRRRRRAASQGHPRPRLRILPLAVRQRRGQEGRPVLHAALRRHACWSRCSSRTRAASTTRAAARAACSCIEREVRRRHARRQGDRRHRDLRPGVELHHLAAREDESRHPRHRRARSRTATASTTTCTRTSRPTTSSPTRRSTTATGAASGCSDDKRWEYGVPPAGNANFAWVQHFIHHLAPTGLAGFVLANGSMSSNQSGEGEIRKSIVEADLVDCMVALPGQLFYSTQIPVCLWFLARDKKNGRFRDRRGETLFIDARKLGTHGRPRPPRADRRRHRQDRRHLPRLARRRKRRSGDYADVPASARAPRSRDRKHGHVLTPGRYVGARGLEDDGEPFEEKMSGSPRRCASRRPRPRSWTPRSPPTSGSLGMAGEWPRGGHSAN